jgi:hypothetical protein
MASTKLSRTLIGREVERLFKEMHASRGNLCTNPVTGARFVYVLDPIKPRKDKAYRALLAREWFVINGPADAPPLPVNVHEYEYFRWSTGRALDYVVAIYARSLEPKYDVKQHPYFADYVSGVLWDHENVAVRSRLPLDEGQIEELKKRFPPQKLEGLSFFHWDPPKRKKPTKKSGRLDRARHNDLPRNSFERDKLHQSALEQNTESAKLDPDAKVPDAVARAAAIAKSFYKENEHSCHRS